MYRIYYKESLQNNVQGQLLFQQIIRVRNTLKGQRAHLLHLTDALKVTGRKHGIMFLQWHYTIV